MVKYCLRPQPLKFEKMTSFKYNIFKRMLLYSNK